MDDLDSSLGDILKKLNRSTRDDHSSFYPNHNIYRRSPFVESDDEEDDDDDDPHQAFRSMLLESVQSSSSDEDHDEVTSVRKRTKKRVAFDRTLDEVPIDTDSQGGEEDDEEEGKSHFLYSRLMLLPSVSGGLVIIFLGGDMFLAVVCIGTLVTYLMYEVGAKKRASSACVVFTLCASVVLVYNLTPLVIWRSVWFMFLLVPAFTNLTLTGSLFVLLLQVSTKTNTEFLQYLETLLFTAYPASSVLLLTWVVGVALGSHFAPYALLTLGFLYYRVFLRPTPTSFIRPGHDLETPPCIIDPMLGTCVLTALVSTPALLHVVLSLFFTDHSVLTVLMEVFSLLSVAVFVMSFLNLSCLSTFIGLTSVHIVIIRKMSIMVATVTISLAVYCHGYVSLLLPWGPLVLLCMWAGLGYTLSSGEKVHSLVIGGNICIIFIIAISSLPWSLQLSIGSAGWRVQLIYVYFVVNIILCTGAMYASRFATKQTFSLVLLSQSLVFSHQMALLYQSGMVSMTTLSVVNVLCSFTVIRLCYVNKLPWEQALISASVHWASLLLALVSQCTTGTGDWFLYSMRALSGLGLSVVLLYSLVLQSHEPIPPFKYLISVGSAFLGSEMFLLSADGLCPLPLLPASSRHVFCTGVSLVVSSVPAMKLYFYHYGDSQGRRLVGPVLLVAGVALCILQPNINTDWVDTVKLLLLLSLLSFSMLIGLLHKLRSSMYLYMLCTLVGLPIGPALLNIFFPDLQALSVLYMFLYGVMSSLGCMLGVAFLKQRENHLLIICIVSVTISQVMACVDIALYGRDIGPTSPGILVAAALLILVALVIKALSTAQLPSLSTDKPSNDLPFLGNTAVFTGFIMTLLLRPEAIDPHLWSLWCSGLFLLLRKDDKLLPQLSRNNRMTPAAVVVFCHLVIDIVLSSPLWWEKTTFSTLLAAFLELSALILTLPVLLTLWIVTWCGNFRDIGSFTCRAQALSVLYFTPFFLCFILMPISTTYTSWLYSGAGLLSGTLLWQYKIPFALL